MKKTLNIHEAKTHLSRYLNELEEDDVIVLCRRNQPIAEIHPIPKSKSEPRPIGLGSGTVKLDSTFFEPLPEEILNLFEGVE